MNHFIKKCLTYLKKYHIQLSLTGIFLLLTAISVANSYFSAQPTELYLIPAEEEPAATPSNLLSKQVPVTEAATSSNVWEPRIDQLNLAYYVSSSEDKSFDEALSASAVEDSEREASNLAEKAFRQLMIQDSQWMSSIYHIVDTTPENLAVHLGFSRESILGKYNPGEKNHDPKNPNTWTIPAFKDIRMTAVNGDGNAISPYSNIQEIMSMASVYTYYQGADNYELFLSYANRLWNMSHSYKIQISDVYECSGCIEEELLENDFTVSETEASSLESEEAHSEVSETEAPTSAVIEAGSFRKSLNAEEKETEIEEEETNESCESSSEYASPSNSKISYSCPGHVDLIIHMKIHGFDEKNNLFSLDNFTSAASKKPSLSEFPDWEGWTDSNKNAAITLSQKDWFQEYGLTVSGISIGQPLSSAEIKEYINRLPENISQKRRDIIQFALQSVGKVPYYWGGKSAGPGYEPNQFGTIIASDSKGRILKGLDCSGWINWVYWSATGERLPYESTAGLISCGTPIDRSELQPGDIIIRTGEEGHVIMFLGWTEDGKIIGIHESSGTDNNVCITVRDVHWPYYMKLVE